MDEKCVYISLPARHKEIKLLRLNDPDVAFNPRFTDSPDVKNCMEHDKNRSPRLILLEK